MTHQEQAVSSGYWPLYRFRPSEDGAPLHLDSKAPTTRVKDFMMAETRFSMLARANPARAEKLATLAQADVDERWHYYSQMAAVERALPIDADPGAADDTPKENSNVSDPDLATTYLGLPLSGPIIASAGR